MALRWSLCLEATRRCRYAGTVSMSSFFVDTGGVALWRYDVGHGRLPALRMRRVRER